MPADEPNGRSAKNSKREAKAAKNADFATTGISESLIMSMADSVLLLDPDGKILSINPACEALFGLSSKEAQTLEVSDLFDEALVLDRESAFKLTSSHPSSTPSKKNIELTGHRRDGTSFPLEISVSELENNGDKFTACIVRDGSERKKIRTERESLIERLTQSNAEFERFAYVASHDMQEPLRAMSSFSEIITSEYEKVLDDEGRLYLKLIRDAATRMQTMVVDLLEYARVGKEQAPFVLFNAYEQYAHVLENLATSIANRNAVVRSDPLPEINGNAVQFVRLLQNIIGNGLKYCESAKTPCVRVSVLDQTSHWEFLVKDNGIGIEEKNLAKIFEPFKRLHNRDKYAGTGLGLSVSKKIVENHGGTIWCLSELGQGSVFHFTWPK